jgi:hypothetical protein
MESEEGEFSEEKQSDDDTKEETPEKDGNCDGDGNEERGSWREEYRTRGYVEVDEDYYTRRAEMEAWTAKLWAEMDFSGITFAGPDDEFLKAITVPYGALHPRIRQPFMEEDEEEQESDVDYMKGKKGHINNEEQFRGREKTEEEVDREIIAFLKKLRNMDPQPQVRNCSFRKVYM